MKLLQLNATANWGSTGKIAEGISEAAINRGWEAYIAFGRYCNKSKSDLIKVGSQLDVYKHYAKHILFDNEGFGSHNSTKRLIKRIEEIKPDIIQIHNIHDHWINFRVLFDYLNSSNIQVVWTFHDCWPFTGGCYHFVENNCYQWQSDCKDCDFRHGLRIKSEKNLEFKTKLIKSLRDKLNIVSVSRWLDSMVTDSHLTEINHTYIYNGVDTEIYNIVNPKDIYQKYNLKDEFIILGVSSVWPASKGLGDFIKLRGLLDESFKIILVGLTKSQIRSLPNGIIGIERTSDVNELVALYNLADVVGSFSKGETFGLTLVEGQACGTPSLAYSNTALNEIVTDQTGFKIETGDIRKAAEKIRYLRDHNPFSPDECRSRVIREFNKENQFNKYINLYESLIS